MPEEKLQATWAGTPPWSPLVMASALRGGDGVLDTFRILLDRLYTIVDDEFHLDADHGISRQAFIDRLSRSNEAEARRA